jgi:hypothetical protein
MADTLASLNAQALADPMRNPFLNRARADALTRNLATQAGNAAFQNRFLTAQERLLGGQTREAITELELLRKAAGLTLDVKSLRNKPFFDLLGIAYLRLGEQENCATNSARNVCIIPFAVEAQHARQEAARKAIAIYEIILRAFPDDYGSRWLLNIAHMAIGGYPTRVPKALLIPGLAAEANSQMPVFSNVAAQVGVAVEGLSGGLSVEDFNRDGFLDLFVTSWGLTDSVHLFMADGRGGFVDRTKEAGLAGIVGGLNNTHADYDNDGYDDILVLRGAWFGDAGAYPPSLLHNRGDGTFEDVTFAAGLASFQPTHSAAWADFNLDGFLDLFVGHESSVNRGGPSRRSELFVNNRDGTFTEVSRTVNINLDEFVKGIAWGDINNDGLPDLYASVLWGPNRLYLNRGGRSLESSRLYRNMGDGTFEDATRSAGLEGKVLYAMGANFGDLDNDGWLDFYVGTGNPDLRAVIPNRMFRGIAGRRFEEVSFAGGFAHIQKGHATAFVDLDRDGDEDIYMVMGGAYQGDRFSSLLFENPGSPGRAWITLELEGRAANRSAIGARVAIDVADANGVLRTLRRTIGTGGSFGAGSLQLHVGLGSAVSVKQVRVTWPDAARSTTAYANLSPNRVYHIVQGREAMAVPRPPVPFQRVNPISHEARHVPP